MTLPTPDFTPNVDPVPGWTPPPMPPRTPVEGRFVRLEPISAERHGADLFAAFSADAEGREWTWRMQAPFETREALDAWLRELEAMTDTLYFAYIDRATGRAFGNGALMSIVPASGSIETGSIMIGKEMQGTPASTEAQYLKARLAFDLGYRRFEWTCDPLNAASMRAAARLGFSYELTHRAAYVTKGRNRDKAVFAMLDRDWPQLRAAFESWLAPENFDGQGQQLQSLRDLTAPLLHHTAPETDPGPHRNALGQAVGAPVPGWTTPATPPADPAEGRFCRLEKLDADRHAEALFEANTSSDNWTYLPYGPFERLEDYSKWVASAAAAPDPYFHAILDPQTGRAVGVASLMRINPQAGSIEVGHINYSPLLQRHPAATEAMYLLMKRAFELGYRRYEWKCDAANAPSRAAALRLGFVYEGIYRQATVTKGRNRDTAWFSILDHEWPALRAAFEAWLAPANFDADGQQRRSLADIRADGA